MAHGVAVSEREARSHGPRDQGSAAFFGDSVGSWCPFLLFVFGTFLVSGRGEEEVVLAVNCSQTGCMGGCEDRQLLVLCPTQHSDPQAPALCA